VTFVPGAVANAGRSSFKGPSRRVGVQTIGQLHRDELSAVQLFERAMHRADFIGFGDLGKRDLAPSAVMGGGDLSGHLHGVVMPL